MAKKKSKTKNVSTPQPALLRKARNWLDVDFASHAVKVAKRQIIEARIVLITTELRAAEAELRWAEAEIAQHAGEVEYERE